MKLQTAKHIRLLKLMSNQKFENFKIQVDRRRPTRKLRKISITFYFSAQNSEKSAYNHFLPNHWNIQTFTIFLQTFDQFWWNFSWLHILGIQSIIVKCQKIQESGRCRFEKNCQMRYLSYCFTDFDEIWCHDVY